ncbi:DUF5684 domain-containing protein [Bernardetia sp.]|uniref:DUF5684 domain-containing protein n=1 Tax=Bernardetia sp. TaxID=1937974 RepID=UPI0025C6B566|nr:DUF5684 domain-containing protein [Bernardetia sp.]
MLNLIASSFGGDLPVELISQFLPTYLIVMFLYYVVPFLCLWKVFDKAGKTPWLALIPIINFIIVLEIIEKPKQWIIFLFFPIVNYVFHFIVYIQLAKKFQKNAGFGVGMTLLPFVFLPILAFGDAQLEGRKEIFYDDKVLDRG